MPITRTSLLVRLRADADPTGWCEFVQLYEPLLSAVVRRAGILDQDVPDVVQDILVRLLRVLPEFEYAPARGRFRAWLGAVCRTSIADWRRRQRRSQDRALPVDVAGYELPNERQWDIEHRRYVLCHALSAVGREVSASAWTCFEQYVLRERSAVAVAAELQLTPAAVYVIASRVRSRLRQKCAQFDEDLA